MSAVPWRTDEDKLTLSNAERQLAWAAGGEWSARITPEQARLLLQELEWLRAGPEATTYTRDLGGGMSGIGAPPDFGRRSA